MDGRSNWNWVFLNVPYLLSDIAELLAERAEQIVRNLSNTAENLRLARIGLTPQLSKLFNSLVDILRLFWFRVASALQCSKSSNAGIDVPDLLHRLLLLDAKKSCAVSKAKPPRRTTTKPKTHSPLCPTRTVPYTTSRRLKPSTLRNGVLLRHQGPISTRDREMGQGQNAALGETHVTSKRIVKDRRNHRNGGPWIK